jgi:hypothetical protein
MDTSSVVYSKFNHLRNGNGGNGNGNGSGKHSPLLITGREVFARTNRGASERAGLGAQLVLGEAWLTKLTAAQAAVLTHTTLQNIYAAMHLAPKTRARVAAGELTLAEAAKANGLLAAWISSTPDERAALGVAVGVDKIWDAVISPSI